MAVRARLVQSPTTGVHFQFSPQHRPIYGHIVLKRFKTDETASFQALIEQAFQYANQNDLEITNFSPS